MAPKRGRLFLAGGSGMVGQNIRHHPRAADWDILAPTSSELDLTDALAVTRFYQEYRPDIVIHAAGRVGGIQANMANPVAFLDDNTRIGRNVIMGAFEAGVTRLINLASTCVYPRAAPNPLTEDMILTGAFEPTNEAYAIAKVFALRLCQYIEREHSGLCYRTLIPCNLFGRFDTFDPQRSHLVAAIIHKIHEAKESGALTVEIWGDGTARREFMFAADLADAVLRAAGNTADLPGLMNVGIGQDHTINTYYQTVAEVIGWQGRFTHDLSKPVGMAQKLCATDRLRAWGWSAPTSLADGIRATYDHYLSLTPP